MELYDILNIFGGVIAAAWLIARVVRIANGARLTCLFQLSRAEIIAFWVYAIFAFAVAAHFSEGIEVPAFGVCSLGSAVMLLLQIILYRRQVNPPAPPPDSPAESN